MPQIPQGEKTVAIAIVRNFGNPIEAIRLQEILVTYSDVITAVGRQLNVFSSNNAYITEFLLCFDSSQLLAVGIYLNRTENTLISDPVLLVNSTFTGGIFIGSVTSPPTSPPTINPALILLNSTVNNVLVLGYLTSPPTSPPVPINIPATVVLPNLYIGAGSTLDILDATNTGAFVNNIYIKNQNSLIGSLNVIRIGSGIGNLQVDEGAYFGGYENYDPEASCTTPVTGLAVSHQTGNTIELSWTPPGITSPPVSPPMSPPATGFLYITIYYKKLESGVWLLAGTTTGDFIGFSGYIFRYLESNTTYNFKVVVTCLNAGLAETEVNGTTTCCP